MIDADYVTELDVLDPEIAGAYDMVECAECGDTDEKMNMVEQYYGEYLCGPHHYERLRDYHDYLTTMMNATR